MDLSKRIDYEFLYTLELRDPVTDEPLGISFKLRSAGSDAAKKVLRAHTDRQIERLIKGRKPNAQQRETEELERIAACIASWNWGSHDWKGKKPELSMRVAMEVFDEAPWIYDAVAEAVNKVENFSPASPATSAST